MNLSAVEALACILIVLAVVKSLLILINVQSWLQFMRRLYANPKVASLFAVALAGVVLYLLVRSGLTIVQILAVCLFVSLLFVAGMAPFFSVIEKWFEGKDGARILKEQWLYTLVWFLLLGWGAYELAVK